MILGLRSNRKRIAIIGAGASGTLLAVRAALELRKTDIYLIERSGDFGPGLAYGVSDPVFLLNVPAAKMGAFHEAHDHFFQWMQNSPEHWRGLHPDFFNADYKAGDFVPRMIYGAYLKHILHNAEGHAKTYHNDIIRLPCRIKKIMPSPARNFSLRAVFGDHTPIDFDAVVFATGNAHPKPVPTIAVSAGEMVCANAYDPDSLGGCLAAGGDVLVLGSGLSMVDTVYALKRKGFSGRITAVSRNGLLPFPHAAHSVALSPPFHAFDHPPSMAGVVGKIRSDIRAAMKKGTPWQSVIDSLRPVSDSIWCTLWPAQQKRLGRIKPWWNVARHRIPDFVHAELTAMMAAGTLAVEKGRIADITHDGGGYTLALQDGRRFSGRTLFHCTGFDYSADTIRALCSADIPIERHWSGSVMPVPSSFGRISVEYPVFALGPPFSGYHFESTAINEIRMQARALVGALQSDTAFLV